MYIHFTKCLLGSEICLNTLGIKMFSERVGVNVCTGLLHIGRF